LIIDTSNEIMTYTQHFVQWMIATVIYIWLCEKEF